MSRNWFRALAFLVAVLMAIATQLRAQAERIDTQAIQKIRDEGFNRSKVMEISSWLTDVYGARLTGSPNLKRAADWTVGQMKTWGISNPHLESWGPFGRGWSNERFSAQVLEPTPYPIIAYPGAWSESTNGAQAGEVVYVKIDSEPDLAKYRGKLRGKWIMRTPAPDSLPAHFRPDATRQTDSSLAVMAA